MRKPKDLRTSLNGIFYELSPASTIRMVIRSDIAEADTDVIRTRGMWTEVACRIDLSAAPSVETHAR